MQIRLPEEITKNLQNTKDFLDNAKDSVNQNIGQAKTEILQRTGEAIKGINQITEDTKETLIEAAGSATEKTGQLIHGISDTTNKSLNATLEKINNLNQALSEGLQASISSSLATWIDKHPQLIWLINHPLQSFGILFLGLLLFSGLLGAISKITEKFWLLILTYPFKLMSNGFGLISNLLQKDNGLIQKSKNKERVLVILNRLELIREEHNLLSQELKTLLK